MGYGLRLRLGEVGGDIKIRDVEEIKNEAPATLLGGEDDDGGADPPRREGAALGPSSSVLSKGIERD